MNCNNCGAPVTDKVGIDDSDCLTYFEPNPEEISRLLEQHKNLSEKEKADLTEEFNQAIEDCWLYLFKKTH